MYAVHHAGRAGDERYISAFEHYPLAFLIAGSIPIGPVFLQLAAAAMVWVSFARPEWSDHALFSAALILTSTAVLGGSEYIFRQIYGHLYGSTLTEASLVAYGSWLLIAHVRRSRAGVLICLCAMMYAIAFPIVVGYAGWLDAIGAILFAAAIFSFGLAVAQHVGVRLFSADNAFE